MPYACTSCRPPSRPSPCAGNEHQAETAAELASFVLLPIGLGLFGFLEPCAIGASLLFVKTIEGQSTQTKTAQVFAFILTRAFAGGPWGHAV